MYMYVCMYLYMYVYIRKGEEEEMRRVCDAWMLTRFRHVDIRMQKARSPLQCLCRSSIYSRVLLSAIIYVYMYINICIYIF